MAKQVSVLRKNVEQPVLDEEPKYSVTAIAFGSLLILALIAGALVLMLATFNVPHS